MIQGESMVKQLVPEGGKIDLSLLQALSEMATKDRIREGRTRLECALRMLGFRETDILELPTDFLDPMVDFLHKNMIAEILTAKGNKDE